MGRGTSLIISSSFIQQPGLVGCNWLWWWWSLLWLGCHLKERKKVRRVANIYGELGSWAWGCRSRLQVVEAAAKLVPKWLEWSCWGDGSCKMVQSLILSSCTYRSFNTCLNLCTQHTLLNMLMSPVPPYQKRWPTWKLYRNLQILHKAAIMISTMTEATP